MPHGMRRGDWRQQWSHLALPLVSVVLLAGCGGTNPQQTVRCEPPPAALLDAIREANTPGVTLGRSYIGPATHLHGGPPMVEMDMFAHAYWIVADLNVNSTHMDAVWLTSARDTSALILGVNSAAKTYNDWGADLSGGISGDGMQEVLDCLKAP
jgi:hypothetical protein